MTLQEELKSMLTVDIVGTKPVEMPRRIHAHAALRSLVELLREANADERELALAVCLCYATDSFERLADNITTRISYRRLVMTYLAGKIDTDSPDWVSAKIAIDTMLTPMAIDRRLALKAYVDEYMLTHTND